MRKNLSDAMLSDDQIAEVSGGTGFDVEFDRNMLPEQLQCIKCGRCVSKEEFYLTQKCPDCGGGMFKAVQN